MFILFCILQTVVQSFGWAVLVWLWTTGAYLPELSSYPLVEFTTKLRFVEPAERTTIGSAKPEVDSALNDVEGDRLIRKILKQHHVIASRHFTDKAVTDGTARTTTSTFSARQSQIGTAEERVTFARSRTA